MTTSRKVHKRLKRMALFCLMAASSVGPMTRQSFASETHDSGGLCGWVESLDEVRTEHRTTRREEKESKTLSLPFFAVNAKDELVIDTCSYDAWLTATLQNAVQENKPAKNTPLENKVVTAAEEGSRDSSVDSSGFNVAIAAIAAAASAGNPIPFSQWTEPFAMVGPTNSHSPNQIQQFQAWFDHGKQFSGDFVPLVDFDGNVNPVEEQATNRRAVETAIDSAVESLACQDAEPDPLIGSSVVIATIPEAYHPYDLSEHDEALMDLASDTEPSVVDQGDAQVATVWVNGLFSPPRQPFCHHVFERLGNPGWSPLAASVEAPVADPTGQQPSNASAIVAMEVGQGNVSPEPSAAEIQVSVVQGSADCLLDELVYQISVTLEDESVTDTWLRPERFGGQVASLVVNGERVASKVAGELATVWPIAAKPMEPNPGIGARLLARAEAAERSTEEGQAKPSDAELFARADAILLQWVDVAQSVIDNVSNRIDDVTEVALNRGTQIDAKRR